eukprot:1805456-Pleurochrysis_carterae.AAC.1
MVSKKLGLADSCGSHVVADFFAAAYIDCEVVRTADGWWELCCKDNGALNKRFTFEDDVADGLINYIRLDYMRRPPQPLSSVPSYAPNTTEAAVAAAAANAAGTTKPNLAKCRRQPCSDTHCGLDQRKPESLRGNEGVVQTQAMPSVGQRCVCTGRSDTTGLAAGCVFKVDEKASTASVAFDDYSRETFKCPNGKFQGCIQTDAEDAAGVYFVLRSRLGPKLPEAYLTNPAANHFFAEKWKAYGGYVPAETAPNHAAPPCAMPISVGDVIKYSGTI